MSHPLQSVLNSYGWVFWPLATLTLILLTVLGAVPQNPSLVQFELAGSVSEANKILQVWGTSGQIQAAFSLGLAFLAIITYSNTIGLACVWTAKVSQVNGAPLAAVGVWLAWGQWLAALLDTVTNVTLVLILFSSATEPMPQIALWCAIPKFSLIVLGLLYASFGVITQLVYLLKMVNK